MKRMTLAQADRLAAAVLSKGRALSLKPLSLVVLDPGGHPILFRREDGASTYRFAIAVGKAAGALALGMSSRHIAEMAAERPSFVASLAGVCPAGVIPAAGGVIVTDAEGVQLGAVGVTGDTSDNDELCALAGIEAAGLAAQV
jgi:uncharacterized protein GlcG (DUF336 family)